MYDIEEDIWDLFTSEISRTGERSGLEFMITQYEYEGTWKL